MWSLEYVYIAYEVADEIYIYLENCYNTLNDYYKENIDTLNQIDRLLVVNNQDNLKEVTCNDYTRLNQLVIQYSKRNDCHMQNVLGCQLLTKSEVKSFIKTLYITTVEPFAAIMFGISGASNLVGINEQTIKHYWPLYMNYDHILGLLNGIDCQKPQFRIKYNSVEFPSNVNHSQSITQAIENNNLEVPESTLCTNDINTPSGCVPKFCTGIDTPYRGCTPAECTGFNTNTHELEPYPECIQTNMCVGIDSDGNLTPEGCIPQQCTGFNTETRELEPYPECIRADCTGFNTETQQLEPYPGCIQANCTDDINTPYLGCIPANCTDDINTPYLGCIPANCTNDLNTPYLGCIPVEDYPLCTNTFANVKNSIPRDRKLGNYIKPQTTNVQTCCFGENNTGGINLINDRHINSSNIPSLCGDSIEGRDIANNMLEYMNGCNRNFPDGPRSGPGTPSYRYNQIKQIRQNIESSSPPPSGPSPAPPGSAIDAIQSRIGIELTDEYVNLLGEGIANDCVITQEEISNNPEAVALTDAFKEVTAQKTRWSRTK